MTEDIEVYFSGRKLYGDDFDDKQLRRWYEEEREGYAGQVLENQKDYSYHYHALNKIKLFGKVEIPDGAHALGIGSAYGHEFMPILDRLSNITIIDPSDEFSSHTALHGTPVVYKKPTLRGTLEFPDNHFDLITAFGSLHHVATVSTVLNDCYRCLRLGGHMLIREPIVTQGDWRQRRGALTKNERGIPAKLFRKMIENAGFEIRYASLFDFSPFARLSFNLGVPVFSNSITTYVDQILSHLFWFNTKYHRIKFIEKFGPASMAYVLTKNK